MSEKRLFVTSIIRCFNDYASTRPLHVLLNNGNEAVIKYINNNEGNKCLINEWISYNIAKKIEVNIPDFGICLFDNRCINYGDNGIKNDNFGPAFYSEFIKNAFPSEGLNRIKIKNKDNFINVIILDHLIYNKDRHPGNYLIDGNGNLQAIDHSHVFKNQAIWDMYAFKRGMEENDYKDLDIFEMNADVYGQLFQSNYYTEEVLKRNLNVVVELVKSRLTEGYISSLFKKIPTEWSAGISKNDLIWLEKYIDYRIKHIDKIVALIYKERGVS